MKSFCDSVTQCRAESQLPALSMRHIRRHPVPRHSFRIWTVQEQRAVFAPMALELRDFFSAGVAGCYHTIRWASAGAALFVEFEGGVGGRGISVPSWSGVKFAGWLHCSRRLGLPPLEVSEMYLGPRSRIPGVWILQICVIDRVLIEALELYVSFWKAYCLVKMSFDVHFGDTFRLSSDTSGRLSGQISRPSRDSELDIKLPFGRISENRSPPRTYMPRYTVSGLSSCFVNCIKV